MMKGLMMDENISNLTSASGEVSATSGTMYPPQQSFDSTNQEPPQKKKRSLPGHPDPDAEVIALSPNSLLATNRFICEICNKGFKRDQNLQLHRRGHNLPWKLKQRTSKEVKKKVYVCPELTCVHHDPSRALGDLTGIKKHFCRKHGDKKWKCEKCSKRYAVQSDWKAHSKICGTREYRCDCGTLFSRRDSFITHRAFCDALAEEGARAITVNPFLSSQQQSVSSASHMTNFQTHNLQALSSVKREHDHHHHQNLLINSRSTHHDHNIPPPGIGSSPPIYNLSSPLFSASSSLDHNPNSTFHPPRASSSPHMSATALLQKAAQMGVSPMSNSSAPVILQPAAMFRVPHQLDHMQSAAETTVVPAATSTACCGLSLSSSEQMASGFVHGVASFGNKAAVSSGLIEQVAAAANSSISTAGAGAGAVPSLDFHDMVSSLSSPCGFDGSSSSFDEAFNGMFNPKRDCNFQEKISEAQFSRSDHHHEGRGGSGGSNIGAGNDGFTRDFLGLKAFSHRDFLNMAGLDQMHSSSTYNGQRSQSQTPWQG